MADEHKDEIEIDFSKIKSKFKGWFKEDSNPKGDDFLELDFGKAMSKLKRYSKHSWFYYILLIPILLLGLWIRTRNLDLL